MKKILCILFLVLMFFVVIAPVLAETGETYLVPTPEELRTAEAEQHKAIDLTPVINAAIALLGEILMAVIAVIVIPPFKQWMIAKMSKAQQEKTIEFIKQMVLAAEQLLGKGCGSSKMEYVINALEEKGFTVDINLIEAAVKEMNDRNMEWVYDSMMAKEAVPPEE